MVSLKHGIVYKVVKCTMVGGDGSVRLNLTEGASVTDPLLTLFMCINVRSVGNTVSIYINIYTCSLLRNPDYPYIFSREHLSNVYYCVLTSLSHLK